MKTIEEIREFLKQSPTNSFKEMPEESFLEDGYGRVALIKTFFCTLLEGEKAIEHWYSRVLAFGSEFRPEGLIQISEYLHYKRTESARQYDEEYAWVRDADDNNSGDPT